MLFLERFHDRRVELSEVGHQQHALLHVSHSGSRFLVAADHDELEYLGDEWRDLLIDTRLRVESVHDAHQCFYYTILQLLRVWEVDVRYLDGGSTAQHDNVQQSLKVLDCSFAANQEHLTQYQKAIKFELLCKIRVLQQLNQRRHESVEFVGEGFTIAVDEWCDTANCCPE